MAWSDVFDKLARIGKLQDGWDSYGGKPPGQELADRAVMLAKFLQAARMEPADRVIVSENGTIYFEWNAPIGQIGYLECEIASSSDSAELRWVEFT